MAELYNQISSNKVCWEQIYKDIYMQQHEVAGKLPSRKLTAEELQTSQTF